MIKQELIFEKVFFSKLQTEDGQDQDGDGDQNVSGEMNQRANTNGDVDQSVDHDDGYKYEIIKNTVSLWFERIRNIY